MAEIEDINRNITYVRGPQGQTVVIVPPLLPPIEKDSLKRCRKMCTGLCIILAVMCFLLASIYGGIILPGHDTWEGIYRGFAIATFTLAGFGAFFLLLSCYLCHRSRDAKRKQICQFMHKEGSPHSIAYRTLEQQSEEEEAFIRNYELFTPESAYTYEPFYPSNQRGDNPQRFYPHQGQAAMMPIQSVESHNPYYTSDAYPRNQSQQYVQRHRSDQPMQPTEYHPQQGTDFNNQMMFTSGTVSPYHSSQRGERSFSPSSDTTYLSNTTSAEPQ